jgi:hypothetical protein
MGRDTGFYAAPIISTSPALRDSPRLIRSLNDPDFINYVMPGIVALSALKASGTDVLRLTNIKDIFQNRVPESTYIATSKAVPGLKASKYFLIAKTAWADPARDRNLTWGVTLNENGGKDSSPK